MKIETEIETERCPTKRKYQNITLKKAKNAVVDRSFRLDSFGLDFSVRVWIPAGQTEKKSKRSYICFEGILNGQQSRYNSHNHFIKALRLARFQRTFDVGEYVNKMRKKICGADTNRNQYAQTPETIYLFIRNKLKFKIAPLDPCPVSPTFDGLHPDFKWTAREDEAMYINPPFRDSGEWIEKCLSELKQRNLHTAVLMLPARMAAPWFRLLCGRAHEIIAINRVKFKNYASGYPWGVFLCILKAHPPPNGQTIIRHVNESFE